MATKTYVLDTSVLIHDPHSIKTFEDCQVVIPLTVLGELDSLKAGTSQAAHAAREASRIIDSVPNAGQKLTEFSPLPGTKVRVCVMKYSPGIDLPTEIDLNVKDNQIIATAITAKHVLERTTPEEEQDITLVSKDTVLRLVAQSLGVKAEDYKKDKVSSAYVFGDVSVPVNLVEEEHKELLEKGVLVNRRFEDLKDHILIRTELAIPKGSIVVKQSTGKRGEKTHQLKLYTKKDIAPYDLRPRNAEQLYALYLLMEPAIRVVTISGLAGSGKSILTLAAGLEQVQHGNKYKRLVVIRPTVSIGEELGFLPGNLDEKLEPWMKPIYDNVETLLGGEDPTSTSKDGSSTESKAEYLFQNKTIEVAPMSFLRGRTISNALIYIDEAQNISPRNLKSCITRAGSHSKVVIAGDIDQIDTAALDKYSCGLAYVAEKLKDETIAAHAILTKSERSSIAELAATLL